MSEENMSEMLTQPAGETQADEALNSKPVAITDPAVLARELEETRKALQKANREAAERRKLLDRFEQERKAQEEAQLTEAERYKKQADELAAELARLRHTDLARKVAEKVGLPYALAERLRGENEEEMTADAETLLATLPQKERVAVPPANPGKAKADDSEARLRSIISGSRSSVFDPVKSRELGGGAFAVEK